MAILIGALLFALPFLLYLLWWRLSGGGPAQRLPLIALALGGLGLVVALGAALHFGLSRSLEPGMRYEPARIEGGAIRR